MVNERTYPDETPYDDEELQFLGIERSIAAREPDTAKLQREFDEEVTGRGARRCLDWWESDESRQYASWRLLDLGRSGDEPHECNAQLEGLGYRIEATDDSPPVDLHWLTTTSRKSFESWRSRSPGHSALLGTLSKWLDCPLRDYVDEIVPAVALETWGKGLLNRLNDRLRLFACKRYGLARFRRAKTLDAIAKEHSLTRERVRQLVSKALTSMRPGNLRIARSYVRLALSRQGQWHQSASNIDPDQVRLAVKAHLSPWETLALDLFRPPKEWIAARVGFTRDGVLYLGAGRDGRVLDVARAIDSMGAELQLPCSTETAVRVLTPLAGLDDEQRSNAFRLSKRFTKHGRYLTGGEEMTRMQLAVEMHERALEGQELQGHGSLDQPTSTRNRSQDLGRARTTALLAYPQLFLTLADLGWVALDSHMRFESRRPVTRPGRSPGRTVRMDRGSFTSMERIEGALERLGAARQHDVRAALDEEDGDPIAPGTVHAFLGSRMDRFQRLSPGMYGVVGRPIEPSVDRFVSAYHVDRYLLARRCGEPRDAYPAWGPMLEHRWCEWARSRSDITRYRALLFHVDPSDWPLSEAEREAWREVKEREAPDEEIDEAIDGFRPAASSCALSANEVFVILYATRIFGGAGPTFLNRVLGYRIDIRNGWATLAVLVAIEWLGDRPRWSDWHVLSGQHDRPDVDRLLRGLIEERLVRGTVDWNREAMRDLRRAAEVGLREGRCSWLTAEMRESLVALLGSGS